MQNTAPVSAAPREAARPGRGQAEPCAVRARRVERRWLAALFLAAWCVRLFYVALGTPVPVIYDQNSYCGTGLWISGPAERTEARTDRARYYFATRGPGYPAFLAAVFSPLPRASWPSHVWLVRFVQSVIGAATCVLVYLVGRRIASRRTGAIAAGICVLYPTLVVYSSHLLSETLAIFLQMLALALVLRGLDCGRWAWFLLGGLAASCAALTRSTLLPALPFLILGLLLCGPSRRWLRRLALAGVVTLTLVVSLGAWKLAASRLGVDSMVGSRGVQHMLKVMSEACDPTFVGWCPDKGSLAGRGEPWRDKVPGLYPVAAACNLIFVHLWRAETLWLGVQRVPEVWLHLLQRVVVIVGLGGLGLACLRWRRWGLVLLMIPPFAAMWVKWIELRHALPFMPFVFLLAGLFIDNVWDWLKTGQDRLSVAAVVLGGSALTVLVWAGAHLPYLAVLFPAAHPFTLAQTATLLIVVLAFVWGLIVSWLAKPTLGGLRATTAGLIPPIVFALLFGSYTYVASDPGWRAWTTDLRLPARQEIRFREQLRPDEVSSAYWLIDLQAAARHPLIKVRVNDQPRVLFDGKPLRDVMLPQSALTDEAMPGYLRNVYPALAFYRMLHEYQQWWLVPAEVADISDRDAVTLDVALDTGLLTDRNVPAVRIGGTFINPDGVCYGPSLRHSLYRWIVMKDWRLREPLTLASRRVQSRFTHPDPDTFDPRAKQWHEGVLGRSIHKMLLSRELNRSRARFNIHLWVRFADGRVALY